MKLRYQKSFYEGPRENKEIVKLAKELTRKGWPTKIYNEKYENISGVIYELREITYFKRKKFVCPIKLGTIEKGIIETFNSNKNLEKFLENYNFDEMKGCEEDEN